MHFPGEVVIPADQEEEHDDPAGQIGCVDDPHIMEEADQSLAPYYAKDAVGEQGGKGRIGSIAQAPDCSDIDLIDGVDPVKWDGIADCLHAILDDQRIPGKESHDVGRQGHEDACQDDAAGNGQPDADMDSLIHAVPFART